MIKMEREISGGKSRDKNKNLRLVDNKKRMMKNCNGNNTITRNKIEIQKMVKFRRNFMDFIIN